MNRYVVTSITGFPVTDDDPWDGPRRPTTEWYILDRFQGYKVCAAFQHGNKEPVARRLAREWNAEERAWEKEDPRD